MLTLAMTRQGHSVARVDIHSKQNFLNAFREHLAANPKLPNCCASCGADLVYLNAHFQVYEESTHFTVPIGFCPCCDRLPAVTDTAVC
jgi:hypothetical protein